MPARRTLVPACLAYIMGLPAFERLNVLQLVPMAPPHWAQGHTQVNLERHPPLALQPPQPPQTLTLRTTVPWHRTTVLLPRCCVSHFTYGLFCHHTSCCRQRWPHSPGVCGWRRGLSKGVKTTYDVVK